MATQSSAPATKIQLTLTGQGADPNSMPSTTPSSSSSTTSTTPDTGFFTSTDSNSATPFAIGGAICALSVLFVALFRRRHAKKSSLSKGFRIHDPKQTLLRLSIFAGSFIFAFLSASIIAPNFISFENSASALEGEGLAISTGSSQNGTNTLNITKSISSIAAMATGSETVTITTATTRGYTLYLSTSGASNTLNYNDDATRGYIAPTSGTTTSRKSLELNHWGFAVDITATKAEVNSTNWAAVPTSGNEAIVKKTTAATAANSSTTVFYGAYVNNTIPAGDYYNSIVYTAIANV